MEKWKIERIDRTRWLVELYLNNIPRMPRKITLTKVYTYKPTAEEVQRAYDEWQNGLAKKININNVYWLIVYS